MPEEIFFLEEISGDDINPYEAVRVASMEARRLNQVRLMADLADAVGKPTTLALERLSHKKLVHAYEGQEEPERPSEEETDDTSDREADTAGS